MREFAATAKSVKAAPKKEAAKKPAPLSKSHKAGHKTELRATA